VVGSSGSARLCPERVRSIPNSLIVDQLNFPAHVHLLRRSGLHTSGPLLEKCPDGRHPAEHVQADDEGSAASSE